MNGKSLLGDGDIVISGGSGGGGSVTVDDELSDTSENPVQNKVVKAQFDKKFTAPSGDIGNGNRPIWYRSSDSSLQPVTAVDSQYIGWCNNAHGSLSAFESLLAGKGSNVMAYANPDAITVEYTADGGTTWVDYGATRAQKTNLFLPNADSGLALGGGSGLVPGQSGIRITVDNTCGVYCYAGMGIIKHYFPDDVQYEIQKATFDSPDTFTTITGGVASGNPGYRVFPLPEFLFGNNGIKLLRFQFMLGTTYSGYELTVSNIQVFGQNIYQTPSTMAGTGHLYTYDAGKKATFPAEVQATTFNEGGTRLSQKYVSLSESGISEAINMLSTGESVPEDADYYVCQYAGGGTATTTYHRRPISALWTWIKNKLASVATSGSYNDLTDTPTIPTVPTKVSAFTNDAGYLMSHQDISGKQDVMAYVAETSATPSVTLALNQITELTSTAITAITVAMPAAPTTDKAKTQEAILRFYSPATAPTVTFPSGIRWAAGTAPTIEASTYYEVSAVYNVDGWDVICQGFKEA